MVAWTFSQLEKYTNCPKQFYHLRVAKDFTDPPTEHTIWGEKVHSAMEWRVAEDKPLPPEMQQWEPIAAKLAALPGRKLAEYQFAVDDAFQPAPWDKAWSRGIVDLVTITDKWAGVFDYKTGKRKPSDQNALYAGYVFAKYPDVQKIDTAFVWLKERKLDKQSFTRKDIPLIWGKFLPTVRKLTLSHANNQWPARPSGLCRAWCAVTSCPHNGKFKC